MCKVNSVYCALLCCLYPRTCELCMRAWEQDYFRMSHLLTFSEVANIISHYTVFHGLGLFENTLKQQWMGSFMLLCAVFNSGEHMRKKLLKAYLPDMHQGFRSSLWKSMLKFVVASTVNYCNSRIYPIYGSQVGLTNVLSLWVNAYHLLILFSYACWFSAVSSLCTWITTYIMCVLGKLWGPWTHKVHPLWPHQV